MQQTLNEAKTTSDVIDETRDFVAAFLRREPHEGRFPPMLKIAGAVEVGRDPDGVFVVSVGQGPLNGLCAHDMLELSGLFAAAAAVQGEIEAMTPPWSTTSQETPT